VSSDRGADDPRAIEPLPFRAKHVLRVEDREQALAREVERLRTTRDAKRVLDAEERSAIAPPEILTLRELLARPVPVESWRIEGWQPIGCRVVFAAPQKAGKTTLVGALTRSLVDGDPWLGRYRVQPIVGNVTILDTEMAASQLARWLREQQIAADERVTVATLRGHAAGFNLLDREIRSQWVQRLRAQRTGYLILDCLRPVLDACGLDEHRDIGRLLVAFDALLQEAGIGEALVVHHMGHTSERSRGDSRIRDWPDAEWRILRESEDSASPRYIAAYGRDVNIRESRLTYDPATRRLTFGEGSRRDAVTRAALEDVLAALTTAPEPLSMRRIEEACAGRGHSRRAITAAIGAGIRKQAIVVEPGPKRAMLHRLPSQCASAPQCATSAPAHSDRGSAPVRQRPYRAGHSHTQTQRTKARGRKDKRAAH